MGDWKLRNFRSGSIGSCIQWVELVSEKVFVFYLYRDMHKNKFNLLMLDDYLLLLKSYLLIKPKGPSFNFTVVRSY